MSTSNSDAPVSADVNAWTTTRLTNFVTALSASPDPQAAAQLVATTLTETAGALAAAVIVGNQVVATAGANVASADLLHVTAATQRVELPSVGEAHIVTAAITAPASADRVVAIRKDRAFSSEESELIHAVSKMLGISRDSATKVAAAPPRDRRNQTSRSPVRLSTKVLVDPLTGLDNHESFAAEIDAVIAAVEQGERSSVGCVFAINLDYFDAVNQTHGHHTGDQLLTVTASRMRNCLREGDIVARLDGDQFAVLLPAVTDTVAAQAVAQRLYTAISRPAQLEGLSLWPSASIGVARAQEGDTAVSLLARATIALKEAKRLGRGRVTLYRSDLIPDAGASAVPTQSRQSQDRIPAGA